MRVDDGAVALEDLVEAVRLQLTPLDRRAVEAHHPRHILPGLRIGRDAAVRRHCPLAGVVGRDGEAQIVAEPHHETAQVTAAPVYVLPWVEVVPDAEHRGSLRR